MIKERNVKMSNETERFNYAMDLFFGMNPQRRIWILLMFYLAKERALRVADNYDGPDDFNLMALMVLADITDADTSRLWREQNIRNRAIVAEPPVQISSDFDKLVYAIDYDAHNYSLSSPDRKESVLSRSRWEPQYLIEVSEILMSLSDDWYKSNASWAFDALIRRILNQYGKESPIFAQPKEVTDLIGRILNAEDGAMYNPYAGAGSYALTLGENCTYLGQEVSPVCKTIGRLNMLVNGRCNAVIEQGVPFNDWKGGDSKFEYIVSTLPFGLRIPESSQRLAEVQFLDKSSQDAGHKSIGVYSAAICSHRDSIKNNIVKRLIDEDILETVILLPAGIFATTNIETAVIVVNKHKSNKGFVRFVDARECKSKSGRYNVLNLEAVLKMLEEGAPMDGVADVSLDTLRLNNYRIAPQFYTTCDDIVCPDGSEIVELGTILTPIKAERAEIGAFRTYKPNYDGAKPYGDIVKGSALPIEQIEKSSHISISEDAFIIRLSGPFHATYLIADDEQVAVNAIYCPYRIDKTRMYYQYILAEMSKDYFIRQIDRRTVLGTFAFIDERDFLKTRIIVPRDYEDQIRLSCESFDSDIQEHIRQLSEKFQSRIDHVNRNQSQRKHAVAQVLNEILPSVENIEYFVHSTDMITRDSVVSKRFGTTFIEYIESIHKQLSKVIDMVDNFTSKEDFGEKETISLNKFLEDYCESKRTNEVYKAVYIDHYEPEEIEQQVRISRKDLTQMLDNLFTNAQKHGFTNTARSDYEIRISTEPIHDFDQPVIIKITNNGTPVSESMKSLDKLFAWGTGQGTGIGCWQVKEIAEHFGGDVEYIEYPDDEEGFACEFRIILPLYAD